MSQSHDLQKYIAQMEEIGTILNSMKNLAFMEIHKLSRCYPMQEQAVANIEAAAMDLLDFYPGLSNNGTDYTTHIGILVGSERGFCGDFNESLISAIAPATYSGLIVVGTRLANKLVDDSPTIMATIEGANVTEEVPGVLNHLIDSITSLLENDKPSAASQWNIKLTVVYHEKVSKHINQRQILPPFPPQQRRESQYSSPPILNLDASELYSDLVHQYLFALVHEIIYISLLAENHSRLQHLEAAVKHLDDETVSLQRKLQMYRQEEITEEIEVILLNSENF